MVMATVMAMDTDILKSKFLSRTNLKKFWNNYLKRVNLLLNYDRGPYFFKNPY